MRTATLIGLVVGCCVLPVASPAQQTIEDRGDFRLEFRDGTTDEEQLLKELLVATASIDDVVNRMNDAIHLTQDVRVVFAPGSEIVRMNIPGLDPTDTVVAGYSSELGMIVYSYDKVLETMLVFRKNDALVALTEETVDQFEVQFLSSIVPNVTTILLHEMGHALLHVNGVETHGENPEDLADQLAFFIVYNFWEDEVVASEIAPVVDHYNYRHNDPDRGTRVPSPHSPDETRAENYLCWLYGSSPELFEFLVPYITSGPARCEGAFWELSKAWQARLAPSWPEMAEPDAAEVFLYLVEDGGFSIDEAFGEIDDYYGRSVAVDLAVLLCSPEPDPLCEDHWVLGAWSAFLGEIANGSSVAQAVNALVGVYPELKEILDGIAVYWCSPDPGPGCGDDDYTIAWHVFAEAAIEGASPEQAIAFLSDYDSFLAELVGVAACGDPLCESVSAQASQQPVTAAGGFWRETSSRASSRKERKRKLPPGVTP